MEFLFENPWLIFIVIGIITSLFNKAKGGQGKQNNRSQRQPVQQKSTANQQEIRPVQEGRNKDVPPVMPKKHVEKEYADRKKQEAEAQLQALKNKQNELINTRNSLQMNSPRGSSRLDSIPYKEKKTAVSIEKQKLVDGVVWAEILGPPRALNPHKSIRQKR